MLQRPQKYQNSGTSLSLGLVIGGTHDLSELFKHSGSCYILSVNSIPLSKRWATTSKKTVLSIKTWLKESYEPCKVGLYNRI